MGGPFDDLVPGHKAPGSLAPRSVGGGVILSAPADPYKTAEEQRAEAANARAERADQRAAQAAARDQAKFESEDTMAPPPGNTSLTGEDYLKTIPPSLAAQVRALSEGRRAFPTGTALRSPAVQQLIAAATQFDPTLDAANAATRVATRKDFTSGKSAQNITALNTVIGHLGSLYQSAQDLHNSGFKPYNAIANAAESATVGFPALKSFKLSRQAVGDEMERVFRQAGGNVTEIQGWRDSFDSSSTPDEFRASVAKAMELLNSRLDALSAQYGQGMGRSVDGITLLKPHAQAIFSALSTGGTGVLPPAEGPKGPQAPPVIGPTGGGPKPPPGGVPNYSAMVGGPSATLAHGKTRNVYDPVTAAGVSALIRKGAPFEQADAYAQSQGYGPGSISRDAYDQAVGFAREHGGATHVEASHTAMVTPFQRAAASPVAAGAVGAGAGATAGLMDVAGRAIGGPQYDANRAVLAAEHPTADLIGNAGGGLAGALLAGPALRALSPAAAEALGTVGTKLGSFSRPAGDIAYGATYGASENPDNPGYGAFTGGLTSLIAGQTGRSATRGLSNVIAPPEGQFGPLYQAGGFPTIGQRLSGSGIPGRAINATEQALQSFPLLGSLVARARQIPRDAAQVGAFNNALGELKPFGEAVQSSLPADVGPGTAAHAFTSDQFDKAYDIARSGMQFAPDQTYLNEAAQLGQKVNSGLLNGDQAQQVKNVVDNAVVSRLKASGGVLNGDQYKAASTDLGNTIRVWAKNPSTAPMADALSDYATIFDNAARRNSDPAAVDLLDAADRGYSQLVRIQRASELGGAAKDAGTFTPANYAGAVKQMGGGVRSSAFNRGTALGQDFASSIMPLRDTLPNSGTPDRLFTGQALAGVGGMEIGVPGALAAHPGALAPFALYAPGANKLVTRAIAPRQYTLPPVFADALNLAGSKVNGLAPLVGAGSVPLALSYYGGPQ